MHLKTHPVKTSNAYLNGHFVWYYFVRSKIKSPVGSFWLIKEKKADVISFISLYQYETTLSNLYLNDIYIRYHTTKKTMKLLQQLQLGIALKIAAQGWRIWSTRISGSFLVACASINTWIQNTWYMCHSII